MIINGKHDLFFLLAIIFGLSFKQADLKGGRGGSGSAGGGFGGARSGSSSRIGGFRSGIGGAGVGISGSRSGSYGGGGFGGSNSASNRNYGGNLGFGGGSNSRSSGNNFGANSYSISRINNNQAPPRNSYVPAKVGIPGNGYKGPSSVGRWSSIGAGIVAYGIMSNLASRGNVYHSNPNYYQKSHGGSGSSYSKERELDKDSVCVNSEDFNGTVFGIFECPLYGFDESAKYCCGSAENETQFCCSYVDRYGSYQENEEINSSYFILAFFSLIGIILCFLICTVKLIRKCVKARRLKNPVDEMYNKYNNQSIGLSAEQNNPFIYKNIRQLDPPIPSTYYTSQNNSKRNHQIKNDYVRVSSTPKNPNNPNDFRYNYTKANIANKPPPNYHELIIKNDKK